MTVQPPASEARERARATSPSPIEPGPSSTRASRPRVPRRRVLVAWTLVVVWAGLIWTLGTDAFSSGSTSPALLDWIRWLVSDLDASTRWRLLVWIRKSAHLVEYAILAGLTFRAALLSAPRNQLTTAMWVAIFVVASVATADEARQAFSPARTGSPWDVVIDLTGGAIAVVGLFLVSRRMRAPGPVLDSPS